MQNFLKIWKNEHASQMIQKQKICQMTFPVYKNDFNT